MKHSSYRFPIQIFSDFFRFVYKPHATSDTDLPFRKKVVASVLLLLIKFAFSILVAAAIGSFYEPQNLTDQSMAERFSPWVYLAVGGFILPFFEEVLFRLSLVFKPLYLSISLAFATYYLLTKLLYGTKLSEIDETFIIRAGAGFIAGLLSLVIFQNNQIKNVLSGFWEKNFRLIYYTAAVTFAWLHVLNFEPVLKNFLLTPVLTLPQLFSGLVSGYLRVRFGFIYPLLLHVCTNSLLIALSLLVK